METTDSKKRKRQADPPRITFNTPSRTFERLFKESSLEALHSTVIKKLGLGVETRIEFSQVRNGRTIDLEDEDDFDALKSYAISSGVAEVKVNIQNTTGATPRLQESNNPENLRDTPETRKKKASQDELASQSRTPTTVAEALAASPGPSPVKNAKSKDANGAVTFSPHTTAVYESHYLLPNAENTDKASRDKHNSKGKEKPVELVPAVPAEDLPTSKGGKKKSFSESAKSEKRPRSLKIKQASEASVADGEVQRSSKHTVDLNGRKDKKRKLESDDKEGTEHTKIKKRRIAEDVISATTVTPTADAYITSEAAPILSKPKRAARRKRDGQPVTDEALDSIVADVLRKHISESSRQTASTAPVTTAASSVSKLDGVDLPRPVAGLPDVIVSKSKQKAKTKEGKDVNILKSASSIAVLESVPSKSGSDLAVNAGTEQGMHASRSEQEIGPFQGSPQTDDELTRPDDAAAKEQRYVVQATSPTSQPQTEHSKAILSIERQKAVNESATASVTNRRGSIIPVGVLPFAPSSSSISEIVVQGKDEGTSSESDGDSGESDSDSDGKNAITSSKPQRDLPALPNSVNAAGDTQLEITLPPPSQNGRTSSSHAKSGSTTEVERSENGDANNVLANPPVHSSTQLTYEGVNPDQPLSHVSSATEDSDTDNDDERASMKQMHDYVSRPSLDTHRSLNYIAKRQDLFSPANTPRPSFALSPVTTFSSHVATWGQDDRGNDDDDDDDDDSSTSSNSDSSGDDQSRIPKEKRAGSAVPKPRRGLKVLSFFRPAS